MRWKVRTLFDRKVYVNFLNFVLIAILSERKKYSLFWEPIKYILVFGVVKGPLFVQK